MLAADSPARTPGEGGSADALEMMSPYSAFWAKMGNAIKNRPDCERLGNALRRDHALLSLERADNLLDTEFDATLAKENLKQGFKISFCDMRGITRLGGSTVQNSRKGASARAGGGGKMKPKISTQRSTLGLELKTAGVLSSFIDSYRPDPSKLFRKPPGVGVPLKQPQCTSLLESFYEYCLRAHFNPYGDELLFAAMEDHFVRVLGYKAAPRYQTSPDGEKVSTARSWAQMGKYFWQEARRVKDDRLLSIRVNDLDKDRVERLEKMKEEGLAINLIDDEDDEEGSVIIDGINFVEGYAPLGSAAETGEPLRPAAETAAERPRTAAPTAQSGAHKARHNAESLRRRHVIDDEDEDEDEEEEEEEPPAKPAEAAATKPAALKRASKSAAAKPAAKPAAPAAKPAAVDSSDDEDATIKTMAAAAKRPAKTAADGDSSQDHRASIAAAAKPAAAAAKPAASPAKRATESAAANPAKRTKPDGEKRSWKPLPADFVLLQGQLVRAKYHADKKAPSGCSDFKNHWYPGKVAIAEDESITVCSHIHTTTQSPRNRLLLLVL